MKRNRRVWCAVLLCGALLAGGALPEGNPLEYGLMAGFPAYATQKQLDDAKKQASALEEEKKKTQAELSRLQGLKSDTASYVKELDASLSSLQAELTRLEDQIGAKEDQISQAQSDLEEAEATEKEQYQAMKLRIKYMYENGSTGYMDAIARSRSISELLSRSEYVSQISSYDRKMLNEYAATRETISEKKQELETERASLTELQTSTRAKEASVETLMASKQAELSSYNSQIQSAQGNLEQYNADLAAQEAKMQSIEAEMKRKEEEARRKAAEEAKQAGKSNSSAQTHTVTSLGNISFKWPCPSSSRITSSFGSRTSPTEGASSNHKGIDISASTGASIVAAADGQVVISTYSYSAGNYIMIDHGGGVSTVYMHCSQLLVSQGAAVKKGQTIAKVGSTGYSTGSHLHFGIRSGGSYVNPSKYVSP